LVRPFGIEQISKGTWAAGAPGGEESAQGKVVKEEQEKRVVSVN